MDQYIGNLKQYRAIAMDVGDQDGLRFDATKLHEVFDRYGIATASRFTPARTPAPWRTASKIT